MVFIIPLVNVFCVLKMLWNKKLGKEEWWQKDDGLGSSKLLFLHGYSKTKLLQSGQISFIEAVESCQRFIATKWTPSQEKATMKMVEKISITFHSSLTCCLPSCHSMIGRRRSRFCFRTWAGGSRKAFICNDLTPLVLPQEIFLFPWVRAQMALWGVVQVSG